MSERAWDHLRDASGSNRRRGRSASALSLAAATAVLGITSVAAAADWVGTAGTPLPFEDGANWSGGNVPNAEDANINNAGIATISTLNGSVLNLRLGQLPSTSGSIVQTGGSLTAELSMSVGAQGAGTYDLSGAASSITIGAHLVIGDEGRASVLPVGAPPAVGTFNMSGGTVTLDSSGGGQHILLGHISRGTINMSGGTLTADRFNIGQHGWNLAPVSGGSEPGWDDPAMHSRGTMNQTGGTVNVDTALVIAEASGNDNQYNISAGTLNLRNTTSNNVSAIAGSSRGRGTFNISGTANVQVDSHIFAGSGFNTPTATATGAVNISGGTVELGKNIRFAPQAGVTNDPRANLLSGGFMVIGEWGSATSNISGGDTKMDFFQLGRRNNTTSRGQGTQTGGTVEIRRSMTLGSLSPHDNFYDISGGTLNFTGVLIEPDDTPPVPDGFTGDWNAAWRNARNKNELQPGLHVARSSTNTSATAGTFTGTVSNARLTIDGTAAVNIAGGLYNSTGFTPTTGTHAGIPQPGGTGLIEMKAGTLTAAMFVNGAAGNATFPGTGSATYNQTGGTASVGHVTGTGTVNVSGGTMTVGSLRQAAVNVSGGGLVTVTPDSTAAGTSVVSSLSITGSGRLDLKDNKLITASPAGTFVGAAYDGVAGYVDSARGSAGNAMWNGTTGLTTSDTRAINNGDLVSIGVAKISEVRAVADTETTTFAGQTVLGSDTLAMATWGGDANLDGKINIDDYGRIDGNVGQSGTVFGWSKGDFNYDGKINIDDYGIIDGNINRQGGVFATASGGIDGVAAVPEPAGLALAACGAASLLRRHRLSRRRITS